MFGTLKQKLFDSKNCNPRSGISIKMKLTEEKERLKYLLKDTITLLCKNSLSYSGSFTVEALIGITLGENNVVLLNINETISDRVINDLNSGESTSESEVNSDSEESTAGNESQVSSKVRRKRKRRSNTNNENSSKKALTTADEKYNETGNVTIKEEPVESVNQDVSHQPITVQPQIISPLTANSINTLPSMVTFPQSEPPQDLRYAPLSQQTIDSGNSGLNDTSTSPNAQRSAKKKKKSRPRPSTNSVMKCTICQQVFASSTNLEGHMIMKHRIGDPISCVCGKQFPYRTNFYAHRKHCLPYLSNRIESIEAGEHTDKMDNEEG